jgi:hypothetical protein
MVRENWPSIALICGSFMSVLDAEHDAEFNGAGEALEDYLHGANVDNESLHGKLDAKKLTQSGLRAASKKQIQLEIFADKLANNTILFLKSLETKPTDLALNALNKNKTLLNNTADIIEKKFPDSRVSHTNLRELSRRIASIKPSNYLNLEKLGDISREELVARFTAVNALSSAKSSSECEKELITTKESKYRIESINDELRRNNEKLREEIRRGLTNYNCETLLRECRNEKDRIEQRLRDSPDQNAIREIADLKGIIKALQEEERKSTELLNKYRDEIIKLKQEVKLCEETAAQIIMDMENARV